MFQGYRTGEDKGQGTCYEYAITKTMGVTAEELVLTAISLDFASSSSSPLLQDKITDIAVAEVEKPMHTTVRILIAAEKMTLKGRPSRNSKSVLNVEDDDDDSIAPTPNN